MKIKNLAKCALSPRGESVFVASFYLREPAVCLLMGFLNDCLLELIWVITRSKSGFSATCDSGAQKLATALCDEFRLHFRELAILVITSFRHSWQI